MTPKPKGGYEDPQTALAYALYRLWECGVASGMDTDGDADPMAMIAGMGMDGFGRAMVEQVKQLREDYEACLREK